MAIACNQICQWNDSSDGCVKPVGKICPMSNMPSKQKPQTNADRIRAMNDEELKELLQDAYNAGSDDAEAWHFGEGHRYSFEWDLKWLQSPAE